MYCILFYFIIFEIYRHVILVASMYLLLLQKTTALHVCLPFLLEFLRHLSLYLCHMMETSLSKCLITTIMASTHRSICVQNKANYLCSESNFENL